jgi:hypothetical protein
MSDIDAITAAMRSLAEVAPIFGEAIRTAIGRISEWLAPRSPSVVGAPLPADVRLVRPARGSATWRAWRDGRWREVYRVANDGWYWAE